MKNSLLHYGVLGMRWGVRKVTPIGPSSRKLTSKQLSGTGEVLNRSSNIAREGANINRSVSSLRATKRKEDVSSMSDEELRAKVNRMNLEQQYASLNSSQVSKGQSYAQSALEITGSVLAIGASAAAIMLAAKQLKGG